MRIHSTVTMATADAKPSSETATNHGSSPVSASSGPVSGVGGAVVDAMPAGGTKVVVVDPGRVVVDRRGPVVVVSPAVVVVGNVVGVDEVGVVDDGTMPVVDVVEEGSGCVVSVVVDVVDDGKICACAPRVPSDSAALTATTAVTRIRRLCFAVRMIPPSPISPFRPDPKVGPPAGRLVVVESLHLTGPPPTIRRLVQLAAELDLPHEVETGVLRVPLESAPALLDRSSSVIAPLEAGLVRVIRADLAPGKPMALVANVVAAPTLAHLVGRRRHRKLLEAINGRDGVSVGFQPVVDLETETTIGFEALLRVRIGSHDVTPSEVLSAAEDAGRLVEVDGVARSVAINAAAPALGERLLFLNVLPSSLPVPVEQLVPFTTEVAGLGIDPAHIVLEAPVGPGGILRRHLEAVFESARAAGFLIGLDNVRSERDLDAIIVRPDVVKLDRSLLRGLGSSAGSRALGNVLRQTTHSASMLVAQGIESAEHQRAVRDLGVRFGQGWHLGRPGVITPATTSEAAADPS